MNAVRRAVIIGVDEYSDTKIASLPGARQDAEEMRNLLHKRGEFQVGAPLIGRSATGEAIRKAVSDLLWNTDQLDVALFYFSGHAFDDTYGNGFLAPYDMEYDRPFVHGLRMQELNELMRHAINKNVVLVVLDACKSGIAASGARGAAQKARFEDAFASLEQDDSKESRGRIVLASSGPDENSHERTNCRHQAMAGDPHSHGAFTFQMLEALSGLAMSDGKIVTLHDVREYIEKKLEGQTFTFFGSGLQQSRKIRLVDAAGYLDISSKMDKAEQLLAKPDAMSLFGAMRALIDISIETRGNERALELTAQIDNRLSDERGDVTYFLTSRLLDVAGDCPKTCPLIGQLMSGISFDRVAELDRGLVGLLLTLWQAARSGNESDYNSWLNNMKAYEKNSTEILHVAESKTQALKS